MTELHKAVENAYEYRQVRSDNVFKKYTDEHPHTLCVTNKGMVGFFVKNGLKPIDIFTIGENDTLVFVFDSRKTKDLHDRYYELRDLKSWTF